MGMVLVTTMASMSLIYATRLVQNTKKMEVEVASGRAFDLAQSANDWNMLRFYSDFKAQTADPVTWAIANLRDNSSDPTTTDYDPLAYDKVDQSLAAVDTVSRWAVVDSASGQPLPNSTLDWENFGGGQVRLSARILNSDTNPPAFVTVELKAWARVQDELTGIWTERQVRRIAKYASTLSVSVTEGPSQTFDFAYFVNNFGWMWGSPIYIHGNVGSNANLSFKYGPTVNGYLYASLNPDLNSNGEVLNGMPIADTLTSYWAKAGSGSFYPPTNPAWSEDVNDNGVLDPGEDTDGDGELDFLDYSMGFPGISSERPRQVLTGQSPLDVPYLGDLDIYKNKAETYLRPTRSDLGEAGGTFGGVIKQLKAPGLDPTNEDNYNILVDGIYGDQDGENGMISLESGGTVTQKNIAEKLSDSEQWKNGNVALIGTPAQPLVVLGPVVVTNDVVLKGTVKGQGTIYTGRNLHVAGDIEYDSPPNWDSNDPNFASTTTNNKNADLVGFATKGSIILGQYTRYGTGSNDYWNTTVNSYFQGAFNDPTVQAYQTDPTDEAIGYYDPGTKSFHGNYKDKDGGKRYKSDAENANTDDTDDRRYYESSFSHEYFASIATARPKKMHGIYYTNHLIGGRVGHSSQGIEMLGTIVARDEGIVFNKRLDMFYDPRVAEAEASSRVVVHLPGNETTNTDATMTTLVWEEQVIGR